jgi:hypothetical protein
VNSAAAIWEDLAVALMSALPALVKSEDIVVFVWAISRRATTAYIQDALHRFGFRPRYGVHEGYTPDCHGEFSELPPWGPYCG